jgi:hypothetical protein
MKDDQIGEPMCQLVVKSFNGRQFGLVSRRPEYFPVLDETGHFMRLNPGSQEKSRQVAIGEIHGVDVQLGQFIRRFPDTLDLRSIRNQSVYPAIQPLLAHGRAVGTTNHEEQSDRTFHLLRLRQVISRRVSATVDCNLGW